MKHGIHLVGSVPMDNATQVFRDNQIPGTPYIELDGKQVPDSALASVTAFVDYVTQNKK